MEHGDAKNIHMTKVDLIEMVLFRPMLENEIDLTSPQNKIEITCMEWLLHKSNPELKSST